MTKNSTILVLFPFTKDKRLDYQAFVDSLKKYAPKGVFFKRGNLKDLEFTVKNNKLSVVDKMTGADLARYKTIYIRRWNTRCQEQATAAACYAQHHGVTVINSENTQLQSFSKLTQIAAMALAGLPQPDTYISSHRQIKNAFCRPHPRIPFPVVIKSVIGTLGDDNYLVNSVQELKAVLDSHLNVEFMVQAFVPNVSDFRCIVLGNTVRMVIERIGQDKINDHRNNTSKGAKAVQRPVNEFPADFLRDAVTGARCMGREIAGVDILVNAETGEHVLLEVNKKTMLDEGSFVGQKMKVLTDYFLETLDSERP